MRLLWARIGIPYSPATGLPIESQTVSQMVDRVMALPEGTRLYLLAPVVRGRKGEYRKELAEYLQEGLPARQDRRHSSTRSTTRPRSTRSSSTTSTWWWTASWCAPDMAQRLAESFETALKLADGLAVVEFADRRRAGRVGKKAKSARSAQAHVFSEKFACPVSGFTIPEIEPRLFSFNNPFGACPACGGLGLEQKIDADLVVPDENMTLRKGAIAPWARSILALLHPDARGARRKFYKFSLDTQWKDLPKKVAGRDPLRLRRGRDPLRL